MKLLVSDSELIATGYAPFTKVNHHRYNRDFILFSTQLSLYQSICIARISDYIAWVLSPIEIRFEFMQPGVINRQSSFLPWVFFCIVRDVNICVCMGGGGAAGAVIHHRKSICSLFIVVLTRRKWEFPSEGRDTLYTAGEDPEAIDLLCLRSLVRR